MDFLLAVVGGVAGGFGLVAAVMLFMSIQVYFEDRKHDRATEYAAGVCRAIINRLEEYVDESDDDIPPIVWTELERWSR